MLLRLPTSLHYPITVTELLKQPNDHVDKFAPLFSYVYETEVTEGDSLGNTWQTLKKYPTRFESSVEGVLINWKIDEGAVISKPNVNIAEIEEPCAHSVQFGGMCVTCGKDMRESSYVTEQLDSSRATINMVHNNVSLTISENEAARADDEAKRRLLASKKLSLVVDLDQTIIQATVDPTVADWQKDGHNPNHDAVKDVRAFLLKDDGPGNRGCWYYIKLRPGLKGFLENVSKIYELHIYTMGTRAYAKNIANIIDPEHKIFGDRILSRDESGSSTAKNLQRLFPVDTKMVVIIDDRGDVWKWSPNLIKVTPYDFFVGIGDINSSFLPKKPGPKPSQKAAAIAGPEPRDDQTEGATKEELQPTINGNTSQELATPSAGESEAPAANNVSALEQLVAMGGGNDPATRHAQTTRQDEALAAQLEDRPLLQKQKQLEAEDAATGSAAAKEDGDSGNASPSSDDSSEPDKPKHNLLHDHDRELFQLEESLHKVHTEFYDIYYRRLSDAQGGRLGQLRGGQKRKLPSEKSDLDLVPDIETVLPSVKSKVLAGVVIVFSGVVPLGVDVGSTDSAILARSFGARIEENVGRSTTHVVAARNRTLKVRKAIKRGKGRIKIVNPQWLTDSIHRWSKVDERPYLLDTEEKNGPHEDDDDILSESESPAASESGEETDTSSRPSKPTLTLKTKPNQSHVDTDESDFEDVALAEIDVDEASPVGGTNEDWSGMNDELAEFLGSDAEDSDGDSVASRDTKGSWKLGMRGKKRGREENDSGDESEDGNAGKVKKKQAVGNGLTSLSQTTMAEPDGDEDEKDDGEEEAGVGAVVNGEKEEGDGWSEFEDELERELEKDGSEDHGEG
ncbi:hypothetical protein HO133_005116 [Letharia lupina]|uniref:RNA polymerase II subunit A C-terminal domain phosphatase n=1 Tax=Letharia lupina TaxID=560253 RepID=A0A8H6F8V5_9LECA|nr:uncharacterized protein HO133_005116 [Letharia lupina]KAF6219291.1 hypothetical protein HO133_005116 [Letharia lupina]